MMSGLAQILFFQGLGEVISRLLMPHLPGPVVGLVALLIWLSFRKSVNPSLNLVADAFGRHLGLLFVPAAVGVVLYLPQLRDNALGIAAALIGSAVATLAATALTLKVLTRALGKGGVDADR